jgi:hypothetical protein
MRTDNVGNIDGNLRVVYVIINQMSNWCGLIDVASGSVWPWRYIKPIY